MKHVIPAYQDLFDVLQDAVDKEKDAERFYREAAERTDDPDISAFLFDLAKMEGQHYILLKEKLEALKEKKQRVAFIATLEKQN